MLPTMLLYFFPSTRNVFILVNLHVQSPIFCSLVYLQATAPYSTCSQVLSVSVYDTGPTLPWEFSIGTCLSSTFPWSCALWRPGSPVIHLPISYCEDWLSSWHMVLWIIVQSLVLIIRGPEESGNLLTAKVEWIWMASCLHNGFYLFLSSLAVFELYVRAWRWACLGSVMACQPPIMKKVGKMKNVHVSLYDI